MTPKVDSHITNVVSPAHGNEAGEKKGVYNDIDVNVKRLCEDWDVLEIKKYLKSFENKNIAFCTIDLLVEEWAEKEIVDDVPGVVRDSRGRDAWTDSDSMREYLSGTVERLFAARERASEAKRVLCDAETEIRNFEYKESISDDTTPSPLRIARSRKTDFAKIIAMAHRLNTFENSEGHQVTLEDVMQTLGNAVGVKNFGKDYSSLLSSSVTKAKNVFVQPLENLLTEAEKYHDEKQENRKNNEKYC